MTPSMNVLLAQEMLSFRPVVGAFDVEQVEATIGGLGFSFRDEADPSRWVISSDAGSRDAFQARRRADPASPFPYVLLVSATPGEVIVAPVADSAALRALSERFLTWLTTTYDCRVVNESGADVAKLPEPATVQDQRQQTG